MIRILKQGKLPTKKITWYKLKCKNCGTIFCATDRDVRIYYLKTSMAVEFDCPICEANQFIDNYSKDNILVLPEGEEPTEDAGLTKWDRILANYNLIYKKLTSKDEHCPICGKECKLDDSTWNVRWCDNCGHTFYIEKPEEKDEKNRL